MINKIWPIIIVITIIYSFFSNNIFNINDAILIIPSKTIEIFIIMLGTTSLWNGIMEIAIKSGIVEKSKKILNPIIKLIFSDIDTNSEEYDNILGNIIANLLGLGNAATIFGLKAIKIMAKKEKKFTKNMMMLILINTASIQLIPTTLIALRKQYNSNNPTDIIGPIWIVSFITFLIVVVSGKIFIKERE